MYRFPGSTAFIKALAAERDEPGWLADQAAVLRPLGTLASLCGQAAEARPEHRPGIVAEARRRLAVLDLARDAGHAMLADLCEGLGLTEEPEPEPTLTDDELDALTRPDDDD